MSPEELAIAAEHVLNLKEIPDTYLWVRHLEQCSACRQAVMETVDISQAMGDKP